MKYFWKPMFSPFFNVKISSLLCFRLFIMNSILKRCILPLYTRHLVFTHLFKPFCNGKHSINSILSINAQLLSQLFNNFLKKVEISIELMEIFLSTENTHHEKILRHEICWKVIKIFFITQIYLQWVQYWILTVKRIFHINLKVMKFSHKTTKSSNRLIESWGEGIPFWNWYFRLPSSQNNPSDCQLKRQIFKIDWNSVEFR